MSYALVTVIAEDEYAEEIYRQTLRIYRTPDEIEETLKTLGIVECSSEPGQHECYQKYGSYEKSNYTAVFEVFVPETHSILGSKEQAKNRRADLKKLLTKK